MRPLLLAGLLLWAPPLAAQDAAPADPLPEASEAGPAAEGEPALDPVARWEADRSVVLDAAEVELAAFEYLARPFVIFADSPRQPPLGEQLRLLGADPDGLAARDVVVIVDSDPEGGSEARRTLRPRGFGVVLVDKDGRVIQRRPSPLTAREIARAIDRTPIRREELREGRTGDRE